MLLCLPSSSRLLTTKPDAEVVLDSLSRKHLKICGHTLLVSQYAVHTAISSTLLFRPMHMSLIKNSMSTGLTHSPTD